MEFADTLDASMDYPPEQPKLLRVTQLVGSTVRNAQGEKLGKIDDVMMDQGDGTIASVLLSFGGLLGGGEKLLAWEALTFDGREKEFVLYGDKGALENKL
jgi:sporulation protein YlmC with PRC-barrel domain